MTKEHATQQSTPANDYLISPGTLRNLFVASIIAAVVILLAILVMMTSFNRARYTPANETQFQETLQAASTTLEEPGANDTGSGRIPIERAMEIVAEKGLAEIGTELTAASAPPASSEPVGQNPFPADDQAAIEAGNTLVHGSLGCTSCHGPELAGGLGPNLTDAEWVYGNSDADIFETLTNGRPGGMPAFSAQTSEEERWQIVTYLKSLSQGQ